MRELEIVGLAAADGLAGPVPADPGDGPKHANLHPECLNCGVALHGRYCSNCGQTDDDHHRSIFHLMWEAVEGLTHLDGRLAKTLPSLFFHPGRLARDHFEGRRQRHVPPFRLFLITLLIFMFSLEIATHHDGKTAAPGAVNVVSPAPPATPPAPPAGPGQGAAPLPSSPAPSNPSATPQDHAPKIPGETTIAIGENTHIKVSGATSKGEIVQFNGDPTSGFEKMAKSKNPVMRWFAEHGRKALGSQEYFRSIMFEWGHRLAIVLLPIFAGLLTLFYFYKRKFYVYDHLVVAMHFLSFTFLLWAVVYLLPEPVSGFAFVVATIWTPVNLFMALRGAYGSSIVGAAVKALSLWTATLFLFLSLLVGVVLVALGSI